MTKNLDCVEKDGFLDLELFPRMDLSAFTEGVQDGLEERGYFPNGYGAMPIKSEKQIYRFYVSQNRSSNQNVQT